METWGFFGTVHLLSLAVGAAIVVALYFILKNTSEKTKRIVLGILSLSGIAAIIYNLFEWGYPLEYLPLHLCSINAILLPIAILTKNKTIGNMLVVWCLGALAAVVMTFTPETWSDLYGPVFLFFYIPHVLEFGIPILLFKYKIIELDYKFIPRTLAITAAIYVGIHFINLGLVEYVKANNLLDYNGNYLHINYMYSLKPEGIPLLELFWSIIPHRFWYMILVFPILGIYLGIIFLPQILKTKLKKNGLQ